MPFKRGQQHVVACKLCKHPMRDEMETQKIIYGKSATFIRDAIKARMPDNCMSVESVRRHFDRHVDEKREVQIRYMEEKRLNEETSSVDISPELNIKLVELRHLDKTIHESSELAQAAALELKRQLKIRIPKYAIVKNKDGSRRRHPDPNTGEYVDEVFCYDKVEVSHSLVQLFKTAAEEVRQGSKAKREILGMDAKTKGADAITTLADVLLAADDDEEQEDIN